MVIRTVVSALANLGVYSFSKSHNFLHSLRLWLKFFWSSPFRIFSFSVFLSHTCLSVAANVLCEDFGASFKAAEAILCE